MVALKKQFKFAVLRGKAFFIVVIASILIALIGEICVYSFNNYPSLQFWNLSMDVLGALLGGFSFRLLYASCY